MSSESIRYYLVKGIDCQTDASGAFSYTLKVLSVGFYEAVDLLANSRDCEII
jgi:hypothetical protein